MTREEYIKIGIESLIENEAQFKKVHLSKYPFYSHFNLYECFTVKTQHIYGTKNDILFILGVLNTIGQITLTLEQHNKILEQSIKETVIEMKRIAQMLGINIICDDYNEIYNNYFNDSGNYFYWYKSSRYYLYSCELFAGLYEKGEN